MALIDDWGASRECYGPSLVPVLPQAPGGASASVWAFFTYSVSFSITRDLSPP